jgi:hypothetical protein
MTKNEEVVRTGYQIAERQNADGFIGMFAADGTFSPDPPRKRSTERILAGVPVATLNCSFPGNSLSVFPSSFRVIPPISANPLERDREPAPILLSYTPLSAELADRRSGEPRHPIPFVEAAV